jgi:hypothetical protein
MKNYIICDLDGTLCNIQHRQHFAEGPVKDWGNFFGGILEDSVNEAVEYVLKNLKNITVIFITGRPEKYKEIDCKGTTELWLKKHGFIDYELYMRETEDRRDDDVIKQDIYEQKIEPNYGKPLFVLDDRNRVVVMWRKIGLTCFQVALGDF